MFQLPRITDFGDKQPRMALEGLESGERPGCAESAQASISGRAASWKRNLRIKTTSVCIARCLGYGVDDVPGPLEPRDGSLDFQGPSDEFAEAPDLCSPICRRCRLRLDRHTRDDPDGRQRRDI